MPKFFHEAPRFYHPLVARSMPLIPISHLKALTIEKYSKYFIASIGNNSKVARPGLERDWREVLGTSPDSAGQGKPELTEAQRVEGIPEGPSRPSVAGGSAPKPWSSERPGRTRKSIAHVCLQPMKTL